MDIDKDSILSWCFCIKEYYYCICKYFEQLKQRGTVQVFPLEVFMFPGVKRLAPGVVDHRSYVIVLVHRS